jgi:hypothetical protein
VEKIGITESPSQLSLENVIYYLHLDLGGYFYDKQREKQN